MRGTVLRTTGPTGGEPGWRRHRQVLAVQPFHRLLGAHALATLGQLQLTMAVAGDAQARTSSGLWLSVAVALGFAPYVLFSYAAGVLADRRSRSAVLRASIGARIGTGGVTAAAVLAGAPVPLVITLAAVTAIAATPSYPALAAVTPPGHPHQATGCRELPGHGSRERRLGGRPRCAGGRAADRCPGSPGGFPFSSYLGLWDTVKAAGMLRWDPRWPYTRAMPNAGRVRHAVSIDERRRPYAEDLITPTEGTRLEQVWFAGVHSDVGGTFAAPKGTPAPSTIALKWATDAAIAEGLLVRPRKYTALCTLSTEHATDSEVHDMGWIWSLATTRTRPIPDRAAVHASVAARLHARPDYAPGCPLNSTGPTTTGSPPTRRHPDPATARKVAGPAVPYGSGRHNLFSRALPARKVMTLLAGIRIRAPLLGLRPCRAADLSTSKVPKSPSSTDSPAASASTRASSSACTTVSASTGSSPVAIATCSTILDLSIPPPHLRFVLRTGRPPRATL